jgi:hypothetical protein
MGLNIGAMNLRELLNENS